MGFDDYKVVLYRSQPDGWVAEVPAIPGCHALMPTREDALVELAAIFRLISEEYGERNQPLPGTCVEEKGASGRIDHQRRPAPTGSRMTPSRIASSSSEKPLNAAR